MQNLLSSAAESTISNLYTMNIRLSGVLALNRAIFRDQIEKDPAAKQAAYKFIGTECIFLLPHDFPLIVEFERS